MAEAVAERELARSTAVIQPLTLDPPAVVLTRLHAATEATQQQGRCEAAQRFPADCRPDNGVEAMWAATARQ
ncbi:hypothetical protein M8C13_06940 [Crossiella sp. SN42]|uniref:hypothetical protein n=1 Tax=Crossiella sp. SN42 TaxID=2944808 RepID=UPI00207CD816|nr:hypothetical protein [Crossiella sp. SN42]MCO1575492.1 hypothetical protein [Crossiella sp. SN42]